jgi:lysine 6-dehydrogenase
MKIAVLGAGMVGRAIARDLSQQYIVTSFDLSADHLNLLSNSSITTMVADLGRYENYPSMLEGFDMAVCAVPGFMGYKTVEAVIKAGKNLVDISFFPENALELDALAREKNVTAIVDCGVAPGICNFVIGRYNQEMKVSSMECMVGGLPKERRKPFEYKAPFSPIDVIEEYLRPARYMENGHIVTKPALSDPELVDFEKVGTLEAFNTDGLRSILLTMSHIPDIKEKTLRYPGHIALIQSLKQAGFFDEEEVEINGTKISPMKFTSKILFDSWKLKADDPEFTIMTISIKGSKDGEPVAVDYSLYDEYDAATQTSSMSRTTGYTCNAAVNLIAKNMFTKKGVFPPELVGDDEACFNYVIQYLRDRNVNWIKK